MQRPSRAAVRPGGRARRGGASATGSDALARAPRGRRRRRGRGSRACPDPRPRCGPPPVWRRARGVGCHPAPRKKQKRTVYTEVSKRIVGIARRIYARMKIVPAHAAWPGRPVLPRLLIETFRTPADAARRRRRGGAKNQKCTHKMRNKDFDLNASTGAPSDLGAGSGPALTVHQMPLKKSPETRTWLNFGPPPPTAPRCSGGGAESLYE